MKEIALPDGRGVRLEFTSQADDRMALYERVAQEARRAGLPPRGVSRLTLVVDEAVSNVVRHGYNGEVTHSIELEIRMEPMNHRPALQLTLLDRGRQVEPRDVVGRDLDEIRPGGLGTHIIRSVMDDVRYAKRPGGGMELHLVKYLDHLLDDKDPTETGVSP